MEIKIPDFIVHYSRSKPFRSITSVDGTNLDSVIESLDKKNSWGLNRFKDPNYLKQRLEIEKTMRLKFIDSGGIPILSNPIYFFLGRHPRFEEHPLNIGYAIKLKDLHRSTVSFSYGDTMLSLNNDNRKLAGEKYNNPLCDKLYTLDNLKNLFNDPNYPSTAPLAIEAHLWIQPTENIVEKLPLKNL